jgi:hypothetical protein
MPWLRKNNPFEPEEEPKKEEKPIPSTMVRVFCEGCDKAIDIRVAKKDNGKKIISCHNCLQIVEVYVNSKKDIQVFTSKQNGSGRHRAEYEKVWQE